MLKHVYEREILEGKNRLHSPHILPIEVGCYLLQTNRVVLPHLCGHVSLFFKEDSVGKAKSGICLKALKDVSRLVLMTIYQFGISGDP